MPSITVSAAAFRRIAFATLVAYAAIIVTGGAVRLTGSGLGCPDWPACYHHGLTAAFSFHPMVEFVNRCITVAVTVLTVVVIAAAVWRSPRRRDLVQLSSAIGAGIVAQIVMGGLVVHFDLNPYLVMAHFLLSVLIVGVAATLWYRSGLPDGSSPGRGRPVVGKELVWLGRILLVSVAAVIAAGTAVTGAGPHAGDPHAGVRRIPVAFRDIAELHSTMAMFLIGLMLATVFALRQARAPEPVQRRAQLLFELLVVQGALGFTQYFLHDNPLVVGVHMAVATAVFAGAVLLYLSLFGHEAPTRDSSDDDPGTLDRVRPEAVVAHTA
ncbi:MAG TPA: COX15/CtaA family protein [Acidimicrobiales bacterium]|nr:COX15/CtaA family protein [Acidimicrobiales bacterium]